ncbi:translocation/assembly module TamB domain-containing protein [Pontiellaceae bacterium B12219]|nr:translocation/assembly module TamB domain-containing protein [Pontiellaceae bacterium B12219]
MKKKRSILKVFVGLLLLLPVLAFLFIQTPPGKALLARTLSSVLSRSEQLEVRIGTISGWIPGKVNISRLEVGDAEGIWLTADGLQCRWMIQEIFKERIHVPRLSAEAIVWHRFPTYGKPMKPDGNKTAKFQPREVRLDGLSVERFQLDKAVTGTPLSYSVHSGEISLLPSGQFTGILLVGGDAEGVVELDARVAGTKEDQLNVSARLDRMTRPTFGLEQISGEADAVIRADGVTAVLKTDLLMGGQTNRLATRLQFKNKELQFQQFQFKNPDYSGAGDLSLAFSNATINVALDSSFINAQTNRFDVRGTADVSTKNKTWGVALHELEIRGWDAVSMVMSGQLNPDAVRLVGTIPETDLGRFPMAGSSNFNGRVSGSFSVRGLLGEPAVAADLSIVGLSSAKDALDELPELDFHISGGLAEGMLFAQTSITNYTSGYFLADLKMPAVLSLNPPRYAPVPRSISGNVDASLDLDIFNRLALFENQFIAGWLNAQVSYNEGVPSGFLKVENGHYENYALGFVFRDFNADFEANETGFVAKHAVASDGGAGRVALSGGVMPRGFDLNIDFSKANIVSRDEITAQVSGNLQVNGPLSRPLVAGTMTIDRADIMLDNIITPAPPLLTDYHRAETNAVVQVNRKKRKPSPVGLDIQLKFPDKVFVNASMIEAVLGGSLHIKDTPKGVSVSGTIEPQRGFVSFVGKKFRFTEGDIQMDGSIPVNANLDNLTAEYSRRDVTGRLVLNGPVSDPRFRLESTPSMPEDEVLSHVLFNRDTSSISPYQAYQIAMAARQLSGGMSGPGFMYGVRKAIGVDTLEWREAEAAGEASSVAAGKYITSGLYVEVNQSLEARGETGMMAELEVTRHFSVETYTGPKMQPGLGVNWRNDY